MIRYNKLGYVALNVSDLQTSAEFYRDMVGLELVEFVPSQHAFLRCSFDHHNLVLYPSKQPGLNRVAFELENEEQFDVALKIVQDAGIHPEELDTQETGQLHQGRTFRFKEPNTGVTFEFYYEVEKLDRPFVSAPLDAKPVKITRLGHAVIEVEDEKFDGALEFLTHTLNFKVSDLSGDRVGWAWLRAFPNPLHHSFALVRGQEPKLNHVAFLTQDIDDIGRGSNRFTKHEVPVVFGPGRHKPSNSLFLYFLDPDGITIEYSQGMEEFPENDPRKPRLLEPNLETLDLWGGTPDPRFGSIGKIG